MEVTNSLCPDKPKSACKVKKISALHNKASVPFQIENNFEFTKAISEI